MKKIGKIMATIGVVGMISSMGLNTYMILKNKNKTYKEISSYFEK